jgi:hypothetical protein
MLFLSNVCMCFCHNMLPKVCGMAVVPPLCFPLCSASLSSLAPLALESLLSLSCFLHMFAPFFFFFFQTSVFRLIFSRCFIFSVFSCDGLCCVVLCGVLFWNDDCVGHWNPRFSRKNVYMVFSFTQPAIC